MEGRPASSSSLNALIVGLGQIGSKLDAASHSKTRSLTHASAFRMDNRVELLGGVDSDSENRKTFETSFQSKSFASLQEFAESTKAPLDIASIAVPTPMHAKVFDEVAKLNPRLIILEKPIGATLEQSREITEKAKALKIPLLINYMRRFEPGSREVGMRLQRGDLGTIFKGVVFYSKGLLNCGSHFFDLLSFWLGDATRFQVLNPHPERLTECDGEPDVLVHFGNVPIYFLSGQEENYSLRDIEILGEKGKVSYLRGGDQIEWIPAEDFALFPGYRILKRSGETIPTDFEVYQKHVLDAAIHYLNTGAGEELRAGVESALKTSEWIERILKECR